MADIVQEQDSRPAGCIAPQPGPQCDFLSSAADICIYGGAAFGGKMLDVQTPLATPHGWKKMLDVTVGDRVFDERGQPCRVTGISPIDDHPVSYRITFDDNTVIEACADHQWLTFDSHEMAAMKRRTEEFRKQRRAKRMKRSTGTRSKAFIRMLTRRNKNNPPATKPIPKGTVRTTLEIARTLRNKRGRFNHFIPVTGALILPDAYLPIQPYTLGAWLGDGTASNGGITGIDSGIWKRIEKDGYRVNHHRHSQSHLIAGLVTLLKPMALLNNKHIPDVYLRASIHQRLALLQGLMDTDGYACPDGSCEFDNTNHKIIEGAYELLVSLGIKAVVHERQAKLNGRVTGPSWRITFRTSLPVFHLERKAIRQRASRRSQWRYVKSCERIASKPMRCISVDSPSRLYLAGRSMVPTHNTFGLLMESIRHVEIPNFSAVIFRRTYVDIHNEGGLWDSSEELYPLLAARPSQHHSSWRFPSGATVRFAHLQYEKDLLGWQGSQIPLICWDELTHFSEKMFFYMMSRNRSATGVAGYIRATCNPDPDSWVARFISWWIDHNTGFAIPQRSGVLRWFIRVNNTLIWADTPDELRAKYGSQQRPKSVTFIPAKITDNKIGMDRDPAYLASMMALPQVDRERLLGGNWKIRAAAGMCFKRHWFQVIPAALVPMGGRDIRYWDRAATVPCPEYPDPDWTVGLRVKYVNKTFYVYKMARDRLRPHGVKQLIKNTASQDGTRVEQVLEGDPGSAGEFEIDDYIKELAGYTVRTNKPTKNKYERAKPAMSQAEAGNIKIVEGAWNEPFFDELENFSEDPDEYGHDDIVDCLSGAVHVLTVASNGFTSVAQLRTGRQDVFQVDRLSANDLRL